MCAPFRQARPPPLVYHFNGAGKEYYERHCHQSVAMETSLLGGATGNCVLMDVDHQRELFFILKGPQEMDVQKRSVTWPRPAPVPPHSSQLASIMANSQSVWQVVDQLLLEIGNRSTLIVSHVHAEQPSRPSRPSRCQEQQHHWLDLAKSGITTLNGWRGRLRLADEGSGTPSAVLVEGIGTCRLGKDWHRYCSMLSALKATWACLPSHSSISTGLLLAIFDDFQDFFMETEAAKDQRTAERTAEARMDQCKGSRRQALFVDKSGQERDLFSRGKQPLFGQVEVQRSHFRWIKRWIFGLQSALQR
eukprot:s1980_g2.t1